MENDLLNAVIEVITITPSDYGVKIDAQDKKVYNVSKTLKAGGLTRAWEQLVSMELKASDPITGERGSIVAIGYSESPNKHGGTSRYIKTFRETNEEPSSQNTPQQPQSARTEPNKATVDDFNTRLAVHGFLNAQINCKGLEIVTVEDVRLAIALENIVNEELSKPKGWAELGVKLKPEPVAEDIQTMANEMEDEAIPF